MRFRGRAQTERLMTDLLQVGTLAAGQGGWGAAPADDAYTYDVVNTVRCTVEDGKAREVADGSEVQIADTVITVPSDNASVLGTSRLKVTRRYRTTLGTAEIYRVLGIAEKLHGRVVYAQRVIGNGAR